MVRRKIREQWLVTDKIHPAAAARAKAGPVNLRLAFGKSLQLIRATLTLLYSYSFRVSAFSS